MECPSCQTSIGDSDLCERCGADLSLFKRVLISGEWPPEPIPVAVGEMHADSAPSPSLNEPPVSTPAKTRTYRAVARRQSGLFKKEVKPEKRRYRSPTTVFAHHEPTQESFLPLDPPTPPFEPPSELEDRLVPDQLSEIEALFTALTDSLAESTAPSTHEIRLTDLIVRERSERLDLLFHLLDESLSPLGEKREFVELPNMPPKSEPLISPELRQTLSQALQEVSASEQGFEGRTKERRSHPIAEGPLPLEMLRARAPSASRFICALAMLTDLIISETVVAIALSVSGVSLPLHQPQLITIADDLFSLTLLVAFLLPGFCLYRALLLLATGTTPGYMVYGITPVSLQGHCPSRFQLILRAVVSPVLGLLTAPLTLFRHHNAKASSLIGTRLITMTGEIVAAERRTGR